LCGKAVILTPEFAEDQGRTELFDVAASVVVAEVAAAGAVVVAAVATAGSVAAGDTVPCVLAAGDAAFAGGAYAADWVAGAPDAVA
jgi:hypothetical protein